MASINGNLFNFSNSLFSSSTSNTSGSSGSSLLTDYMSIKNGSYRKLLKAYYSKQESSSDSTNSTSGLTSTEKTTLTSAKSDADALKTAAGKLTATGSKSLFVKVEKKVTDESTGVVSTVNDYDRDAILSAVKDFTSSYNKVVKSALTPESDLMTKKAAIMINTTKSNKALLSDVGIKVNSDYTLTIDEEKFKNADISTLKTLFNGSNSYASQVSQKASDISDIASKIVANQTQSYSKTGSYLNSATTGSLFNGFF